MIDEFAEILHCPITHSAVARWGTRPPKFSPRKQLSNRGKPIRRASLAAVPSPFITIIQDALLYASRSEEGTYLTVARTEASVDGIAELSFARLQSTMRRLDGFAVFRLSASELAANYVKGSNDVRQCKRARVLAYQSGGYLP